MQEQAVKIERWRDGGVFSHKWDIHSKLLLRGSGTIPKRWKKECKGQGSVKIGLNMSSGQNESPALRNTQQLWLSAPDQASQHSSLQLEGVYEPFLLIDSWWFLGKGKSVLLKLMVSQSLFSEWPHTQKYVDSTDWSWCNIKFIKKRTQSWWVGRWGWI